MQMNLTETFMVQGEEFVSPHSDATVAGLLRGYLKSKKVRSNFARDLVAGFARHGSWTDKQRPWAHKLVFDVENPAPKNVVGGLGAIVEHMGRCRESRDRGGAGLKNPQVRIDLDGTKFTLKLAGARSRNAGCVSVASSHLFGEGLFFGWVDPSGDFDRRGACSDAVVALLRRIAVDPAAVISEIGKESGHCCYCWAALSQVQSKIAGCGKTCAKNYGAWYPTAAETRSFLMEHPEVLVGATDAERWGVSIPDEVLSVDELYAGVSDMPDRDLEQLKVHTEFIRRSNSF